MVKNDLFLVSDTKNRKIITTASEQYHSVFNKENGDFARWGKTENDDPTWCSLGPEIADIEVSVNGCPNKCPWCYKGNDDSKPTNMSLETLKKILDKLPMCLTQIAFGITGIQTNPDFIMMLEESRSRNIVPNFTLTGIDLTDKLADATASLAGAVAISAYPGQKDLCYDTVKKFTDRGMTQVNIHAMVSQETICFVHEVIKDRKNDPRLAEMNAIVLLGLKPKGRAKGKMTVARESDWEDLLREALTARVPFGCDSCSVGRLMKVVQKLGLDDSAKKRILQQVDGCESGAFSIYIDVHGQAWPCSFAENEPGKKGLDILVTENFTQDIWQSPTLDCFRIKNEVLKVKNGVPGCQIFPEINVKV